MLEVGSIVGDRFRVERILGQGGMGVVAVATHLQLDQQVAIKVLHEAMSNDADVVARLVREAQASARLRSDHVCKVFDVGRLDDGAPYIVMELLDGSDLQRVIGRGPLPVATAVDYVLQACVAIAEAHAVGIVHRDLKPANLFLTHRLDGSPLIKVLDFGIAKAPAAGEIRITRTSMVMGSPGYMSPEQLRSAHDADARSDIWALGVILYELVSGRLPFLGNSITEIAVKVTIDAPEPLDVAAPEFTAAVFRCLEKSADARYQTVAQLAATLAPFGGDIAERSAMTIAALTGAATTPGGPATALPQRTPGTAPGGSASPSPRHDGPPPRHVAAGPTAATASWPDHAPASTATGLGPASAAPPMFAAGAAPPMSAAGAAPPMFAAGAAPASAPPKRPLVGTSTTLHTAAGESTAGRMPVARRSRVGLVVAGMVLAAVVAAVAVLAARRGAPGTAEGAVTSAGVASTGGGDRNAAGTVANRPATAGSPGGPAGDGATDSGTTAAGPGAAGMAGSASGTASAGSAGDSAADDTTRGGAGAGSAALRDKLRELAALHDWSAVLEVAELDHSDPEVAAIARTARQQYLAQQGRAIEAQIKLGNCPRARDIAAAARKVVADNQTLEARARACKPVAVGQRPPPSAATTPTGTTPPPGTMPGPPASSPPRPELAQPPGSSAEQTGPGAESGKEVGMLDLAEAQTAAQRGDWQRALSMAQAALRQRPRNPMALRIGVISACHLHDETTARSLIRRVPIGRQRALRQVCAAQNVLL